MDRICLVPHVSGTGGMVSFQMRFEAGVNARGISVTYDIRRNGCQSILVIGGTRDIPALLGGKKRGIRIVQRLNGMNWLHRKLKTGLRHYLRAEYGNLILRTIRNQIADHVVYQSEFARVWWEQRCGETKVSSSVIYNAVDLSQYTPGVAENTIGGSMNPDFIFQNSDDHYRVLLLEGSLFGGYELGLTTAVRLVERLNDAYRKQLGKPVELVIAGRIPEVVKTRFSMHAKIPLVWAGLVSPDLIPFLHRTAHLLYSSDINPACPNSVIEALACGTPVLGYDTGALSELVTGDSGRVVPYGGDPWQLDTPDIQILAQSAVDILTRQVFYRKMARIRAETAFDLDKMVDNYLKALLVG